MQQDTHQSCCIVDCGNAPAYTVAPAGNLGLFNHVCAGHLVEYLVAFTLPMTTIEKLFGDAITAAGIDSSDYLPSVDRWYVQVYTGPDAEIGPEPVLK